MPAGGGIGRDNGSGVGHPIESGPRGGGHGPYGGGGGSFPVGTNGRVYSPTVLLQPCSPALPAPCLARMWTLSKMWKLNRMSEGLDHGLGWWGRGRKIN